MRQKTVLIIAGPTAVGKTAVAISVAKLLNTEIISADSRQCYKELNIGVARPSALELAAVPHHFIASHSISETVTAATFEQYALYAVYGLFKKSDVVVMTGGTGLYLKAFCDGLDSIPQVPDSVRQQIVAGYSANGLPWLQTQVQQADPLYYAEGENQNPQRLMRALEVIHATGESIQTFKKRAARKREFAICKIALELPKAELHERISSRVDTMLANGLVEEVERLLPYQHYNALQTVGYKEIFSYLNGAISLNEAINLIKQHTRQYAKRQRTWFRSDLDYTWLPPVADEVLRVYKARPL